MLCAGTALCFQLNERLADPAMAEYFQGIMPKDTPKNTRFAINFFTSIGLGGLTDGLREHLKNIPKMIMVLCFCLRRATTIHTHCFFFF